MNKPLQDKELLENFSRFGLNEKDREVYLALLSSGPNTITPLSRILGIPATTIQAVLSRLNKRGIISATKRRSRHVYEALDPIVFKNILEEEAREFSSIIPYLQSLKNNDGSDTKVVIYYRERITDILNEALQTKNKVVYEIVSAKEFQNSIGEKFHFTRRRIADKIKLKSLRVMNGEIKKYSRDSHIRELREARFLPKELTFKTSLMFWDNNVAFFSTKSEGVAWVVRSNAIKEMVEQIFNLLWSVSGKMENE